MCQILDRLKEYIDYKGITISAFEKSTGMSNASFGKQLKQKKAIGTDRLENIINTYPDISAEWLLTGEGPMLKTQSGNEAVANYTSDRSGIPLIPVEAMAGFFTGEVIDYDHDCERLRIPGIKADFVVPVSGDSMEPKFYSGDLVACQMVNLSDSFFQWGKVYVIDTNQGVLIKKVKRGTLPGSITLISENPDYDAVEISAADIYHIALVKATVRFT